MVRLPVQGVVAELKVCAEKKLAIGRMRPDEEQADLASVNRRATILRDAVERKVKARLEPRGNTVSPFGHTVERLVRYESTRKSGSFRAVSNKIIMPGEIEDSGLGNYGIINLDLISLRERHSGRDKQSTHYQDEHGYHALKTIHESHETYEAS